LPDKHWAFADHCGVKPRACEERLPYPTRPLDQGLPCIVIDGALHALHGPRLFRQLNLPPASVTGNSARPFTGKK
jgi:hypothetical protein